MATTLENGIDWGTQLNPAGGVVTYYFYGNGETTPFGDMSNGFSNFEKGQFELAFALYSKFLNLTFTEVGDPGTADLKLVTVSPVGYLGQMFPPGYTDQAGYGYFNDADFDLGKRPRPGWQRLRHSHS